MTIEDIANPEGFKQDDKEPVIIKVIGVGGGGNNAVRHMYNQNIQNVSFVICNTDRQALRKSPVPQKLMIGSTGLGAGNKPEVARQAAEDSAEQIAALFNDDTRMVFITAGMGGGTGTGAAPVVARIAREHGMLTIGIVTIPFLFEGQKKILKALDGAEEMSKYVDALLVINNERLTEIYPDLEFMNAFGKADDTLAIAARGISELITNDENVINIDFEDVDTTLRNGGAAVISIGYGEGEHRVKKAIADALNSPLLKDSDVIGSKRILFNLYFNPDAEQAFVMKEADELTDFISSIDKDVDVIWGLARDPSLGNKVKITLLAAGFDASRRPIGSKPVPAKPEATTRPTEPEVIDNRQREEENKRKLDDFYGKTKAGDIVMSKESKKIIILAPELLSDDALIEIFEKIPTAARDVHTVEAIRNASRKATNAGRADSTDPDVITSADPAPAGSRTPNPPTGETIRFD